MTKVQVLLSTYNGEQFIDEQVKSILEQNHPYVDILVRDDGSSDQTVARLKERVNQSNRITLIEGRNIGVIPSFMELIHQSSDDYDYYCFCDQDDVWMPDKVNNAVKMLSDYQVPAMLCTTTQMVDIDLNNLSVWPKAPGKSPSFYNALVENIAVGTTITFNKSAMQLLRAKHVDSKKLLMHDWWGYLVISAFGEVIFDPTPSIWYRQHGANVVGGNQSVIQKWTKKWASFRKHSGKKLLRIQAQEFSKHYRDVLSADKKEQLDLFLEPRNSILKRIRFLSTSKLYRQSWIDQRLFQFLILIGYI